MLDVVGAPPRTLASLAPGESARIESFQYGAVRGLCSDLGIREGSVVHCRAGTGGVIVLDTAEGETVSLARDWARFIHLAPVTVDQAPLPAAQPVTPERDRPQPGR